MSGSLAQVGEADFDEVVLASPVPVLVDFFTQWCAPCKQLAPTLEDLAAEYGDAVRIVSVDAEASPELAKRYGVTGYPTLVLVRDGAEIDRLRVRTRLQLREVLDAARGVLPPSPSATTAAVLPPDDGVVPAAVQAVVDQLDALTPDAWARVTAFMGELAGQPPQDPGSPGRPVDEAAMTAALARLQDDVEELAVQRLGAGPLAQAIASAVAASFDGWVRESTPAAGWSGALRAVPAVRMSPYLPQHPAPSDPAEAAAQCMARLRDLTDDEWVQVRNVNRDVWPWDKSEPIGTSAWLGAVILVQAVTSADLVPARVYEAAWEPFAGLLDRDRVEAA